LDCGIAKRNKHAGGSDRGAGVLTPWEQWRAPGGPRSANGIGDLNGHAALVPDRCSPEFVTVHGYRRAYLRTGRGPALLLIHGIGDNSATWSNLVPQLARNHTVIAPDLLGHGLSDKPRADYSVAGFACGMRDLLSVLDVDRVTVVGHSLGGGVAMQFAYQFPERCERLVLVAPGGVGRDLHPLLRAAVTPGSGVFLSLLTKPAVLGAAWRLARALRWARTDLGLDADDLLRTIQVLDGPTARRAFLRTLRTSVDGYGQTITMLDRCYLAAGMPSLIVWGDRDAVIPVEHARILHEAMPGSRLEIFEGAGHFPHRTDPERFRAVLDAFLASTRPASHSVRQWRMLLRAGRTELARIDSRLAHGPVDAAGAAG
jgi:pimeloyl-ACP methyl ester carboxylesterase